MTATLDSDAALAAAVAYARTTIPAALARLADAQAQVEKTEDDARACFDRLEAGADFDDLPEHMVAGLLARPAAWTNRRRAAEHADAVSASSPSSCLTTGPSRATKSAGTVVG